MAELSGSNSGPTKSGAVERLLSQWQLNGIRQSPTLTTTPLYRRSSG